jgi:hypothetical protein
VFTARYGRIPYIQKITFSRRLLLHTSLTDWFYNRVGKVFTARYGLILYIKQSALRVWNVNFLWCTLQVLFHVLCYFNSWTEFSFKGRVFFLWKFYIWYIKFALLKRCLALWNRFVSPQRNLLFALVVIRVLSQNVVNRRSLRAFSFIVVWWHLFYVHQSFCPWTCCLHLQGKRLHFSLLERGTLSEVVRKC